MSASFYCLINLSFVPNLHHLSYYVLLTYVN